MDLIINWYCRLPALSIEGARNVTLAGTLWLKKPRYFDASYSVQGSFIISQSNESDVRYAFCPPCQCIEFLLLESPFLLVTRHCTSLSCLVSVRKTRQWFELITARYSGPCANGSLLGDYTCTVSFYNVSEYSQAYGCYNALLALFQSNSVHHFHRGTLDLFHLLGFWSNLITLH
jgi:hypothetical protein